MEIAFASSRLPPAAAGAMTRRRFAWLIGLLALALPGTAEATGFADLVGQVSPAVVAIRTSQTDADPPDALRGFPSLESLPGRFRNNDPPTGSGFLISPDGLVVTAYHVVAEAGEIRVELLSGETLKATILGVDELTDLAVLRLDGAEGLPNVGFGDSDRLRTGDWVVALGYPMGQGLSASAGIVSAHGRSLAGRYDDYLQTDAAINPGASGGPLFNMEGEVVGVNSNHFVTQQGSIGIGLSMSARVVIPVIAQLTSSGQTRRGWLGVRLQDVTPDIAEALQIVPSRGAVVVEVPDGPARDAGVQAGDVFLRFGGEEVVDAAGLLRRVGDGEVGSAVEAELLRDARVVRLTVILGHREGPRRALALGIGQPPEDLPSVPGEEAQSPP